MKEKITLAGRSLVFNILFVVLNLAGLALVVMGYHDSAGDSAVLFKSIGWILLMLSTGGLIVFKGRLMMSNTARVLVGGLFIVSGLVKANDPVGFAYKLEEYFEDGALAYRIKEWFGAPGFSMEWLIEWALVLSVIICIAEIVLGVLTIIGGKIKMVSYLMMIMMVFFTFLTWHTDTCDHETKFLDHDTYDMSIPGEASVANVKMDMAFKSEKDWKKAKDAFKKENPDKEFDQNIWIISKSNSEVVLGEMKSPQCVDDCGCFGDAMKGSVGRSLTPKESFWKDLTLLYLVIWIFVGQWIIQPNTRKENMVMIPASLVVVTFFSWVFGWYFPIVFSIVALLLALWILRVGKRFLGNYYGSALIVAVVCQIFVTYVLMYEPVKDYRPYAVGSNLREKMNDGVVGEFAYFYWLTDLKTNDKKRVRMEEITPEMWANGDRWKAEYDTTDVVVEPRNPSIMDFHPRIELKDLTNAEKSLEMIQVFLDSSTVEKIRFRDHYDNQEYEEDITMFYPEDYPPEDYTILDTIMAFPEGVEDVDIVEAILDAPKIVMVISKKLEDGNWANLDKLKAIQKACDAANVPFIVICNATREDINAFRKENKFDVPVFAMDEIELKIIARSNPSLLVLENAVVTGKYPYRSTPSVESFKKKYLK